MYDRISFQVSDIIFQQRAGQVQMQSMPNIRGVIPNAVAGNVGNIMANAMPNSMPNTMNAINSNAMNMNMGEYFEQHRSVSDEKSGKLLFVFSYLNRW